MDTKRLAKFLIITFVITGIAWSGLAVLTSLNIIPFSHPLGTILHIIGGFGPVSYTHLQRLLHIDSDAWQDGTDAKERCHLHSGWNRGILDVRNLREAFRR